MTVALAGKEAASVLSGQFPTSIIESERDYVLVRTDALPKVIAFLKSSPRFAFDFLNSITAVDYFDYFEVVYHLTSMQHNHSLIVKTRCYGRENLVVPSIIGLYQGADFQEREIYDLLGIKFEGHPNMRRIFLWDGFEGHPLRKDYL
ncbi:MAG: NADH-quinone oxidoreductase subunit C [Chloroflexi bacterium]|nr:NADH-quinone oxidoreductase subunit C [Chloroflexota bacterium]